MTNPETFYNREDRWEVPRELYREGVASSGSVTEMDRLGRARGVFQEMQRQYSSGNFTRYGELLKQLEELLTPP
jgi:uncharacterized membrane protein (UPF0182 family)